MKLELARIQRDTDVTIGALTVNKFACYTCEDAVRAVKVPGRTAIPAGTYQIKTTFSPRFSRMLPLLLDVPGFDGVRIHPGNTAEDTEGCILPGAERHPKGVGRSREAFAALWEMIRAAEMAGESVTIDITEP